MLFLWLLVLFAWIFSRKAARRFVPNDSIVIFGLVAISAVMLLRMGELG
ncbi:MAG: hypothetical protein ACKVT1_19560 [Dehalococcoidia bacterium]